jgi:CRP-like cAMP-binding protein
MDKLKEKVYSKVQPTDEEWESFSQQWRPFHFEKNQVVTDFGAVEKYFYFVNDGVIRGYFIKNGHEHNMGFSYIGDFSGVYDSFLHQKPATYAMESLTEVNGLRISHQNLIQLFDDHKVFERWGRLFNATILTGLGVFIQSIIADTAEERFRQLMKRSPHVLQLIPQKHLASYLGMSPKTFSRMRKKWMD